MRFLTLLLMALAGAGDDAPADHWAFQPVKAPPFPDVRDKQWPRTAIDRFILAKLEEKGLAPSPPADKRTLLRRATYGLTGLPPTPEEITAHLSDNSPDAFEKVVDRLLASPRYGERWGRHWLDAARYADTKGYVYSDREESRFVHSWAYRDWVIRAFNEDMPYDRFLVLQIAADQAASDTRDLAAMGFLTVGRRFINNIHDIIDDRIDTLTRATMGLTVACARCHDHKFDPIPTTDYYSLYGVFKGSAERTLPIVEKPERTDAYAAYEEELKKRQEAYDKVARKRTTELLDRLRTQTPEYLAAALEVETFPTEEFYQLINGNDLKPFIVRRWHAYLMQHGNPVFGPWNAIRKLPENERAEAARSFGKRFVDIHKQWQDAVKQASAAKAAPPEALPDPADEALRQVLYGAGSPIAPPTGAFSEIEWFFDESVRVEMGKLLVKIEQWILQSDAAPPQAAILEDRPIQSNPRVFKRGNPATTGNEVPRRFVSLLGGQLFAQGSGRLELARAIASRDNPLTARVMVNRVWLHHFGAGIVRTSSDFGLRSEPPSHPELLDHLASRFMSEGLSLKKLHREIMLSSAYRQSSEDRAEARKIDPENRRVWRMNLRRLDFEAMRDSLLAASGQLDLELGGKPVKLAGRRRTVYGFIDRLNLPNLYRTFDFAAPDAHSGQRFSTTVPQQALFLMNSPFVIEQARLLAARAEGRIERMYELALGRAPSARETEIAMRLVGSPPPELPKPKPTAWQYGFGEFDAATGRIKDFQHLPHFTGEAWQGGPVVPDPALGWVYLNVAGGHAGNDLKHAAIRRWTAPRDGAMHIAGTLVHKPKEGDGIRARIVSSRHGELAMWIVHKMEVETQIQGVEVKKGDTLDFVVDIRGNLNSDEFGWAPVIKMDSVEWSAKAEFGGPPVSPLTAWEKFAQVLLLSNEFAFVD